MRSDVVRLFQTLPHPCGYFPERTAQNLVIDPSAPRLAELYELGLQRGYRQDLPDVEWERPVCDKCGWTGAPVPIKNVPPLEHENPRQPPEGECVIPAVPLRHLRRLSDNH